jgi:glycosyltransferase involved in cell wall biosynthesis
MKIVNILLSNKAGGVEDAFVTHCKILQKFCDDNHQILAITKYNAPYITELQEHNILVKQLHNYWGYYDIFVINKIKNLIKKFQADLVFAHVGKGIIFAKKALLNSDIPLIAVNHSNNVKRSVGTDMVLCVNNVIKERVISLGQKKDLVKTIPNVISFDNSELTKFQYSKFSSNQPIKIGVLGRLAVEKNFDKLLHIVQRCQEQNIKLELFIAGEGSEKENLIKLTQQLNITKQVKFLGWIKNKQEFFAKIDIFILPSNNETFGIVLLEAMKYKVPIITTNTDGASAIITDQQNGLLVSKSPLEQMINQIIAAIIKLSSNPQLVEKITNNASKDLQEKYSYQALADIFVKIITKFK